MLRSLIVALILMASPFVAKAQSADIEAVISAQIDAFKSNNVARAFEFAAPNIQQMFRTASNFGTMVQRGYPMVWRPAKMRFGALEPKSGQLVQQVYLTDLQGNQFIALYSMAQTAQGWKIAGVQILRPSGVGT